MIYLFGIWHDYQCYGEDNDDKADPTSEMAPSAGGLESTRRWCSLTGDVPAYEHRGSASPSRTGGLAETSCLRHYGVGWVADYATRLDFDSDVYGTTRISRQ